LAITADVSEWLGRADYKHGCSDYQIGTRPSQARTGRPVSSRLIPRRPRASSFRLFADGNPGGQQASDKNARQLIHDLRVKAANNHKHAPFARANLSGRESNEKMMAKTEKEERLARDRAEIAARVASFRETQKKFEREREQYCDTTLSNAVNGSARPSLWR
jgi:hypothetical protein